MVASHVINLFIKKALKFSLAVFISTVLLFLAVGLSARLTQNYLLTIAKGNCFYTGLTSRFPFSGCFYICVVTEPPE